MKTLLISTILITSCLTAADLPKQYPDGELGKLIKLGEDIMNNTDTHPLTKDFVGNKLKCVSCHLPGDDNRPGTKKSAGTFIDVAARFPMYKTREGVTETLQDRIDNCFMRSMDGERPIIDSEASIAMLTYTTWLSTGAKIDLDPKTNHSKDFANNLKKFSDVIKKSTSKNYEAGKTLYTNQCAACHGANGEGVATFPPVWGKSKDGKWLAYNSGAGMSKLHKAAEWIQANMPFGAGNTLTVQQSVDVSLYINAQERADFDLSKKLAGIKDKGYYNSKVMKETDSTEKNFKALGLDLKKIKTD